MDILSYHVFQRLISILCFIMESSFMKKVIFMTKTEAVIRSILGAVGMDIRPLACSVDIAIDLMFVQGVPMDDILGYSRRQRFSAGVPRRSPPGHSRPQRRHFLSRLLRPLRHPLLCRRPATTRSPLLSLFIDKNIFSWYNTLKKRFLFWH